MNNRQYLFRFNQFKYNKVLSNTFNSSIKIRNKDTQNNKTITLVQFTAVFAVNM